jgi:hypothetical protein
MKRPSLFAILLLLASVETASAVEFEKLNAAIAKVLGTTKAMKKTVSIDGKNADVFYAKDGGKALAVIQKRIYEPNCTHTWVIGVDPATQKVQQIRVVEMSCPHAHPTRSNSFLDQFSGKGPADLAKLDASISTIAKATGSSELTTDAVKTSIKVAQSLKGKL